MVCGLMRFKKFKINSSSYIGIFASISNEYGLFPTSITKEQEKDIEDILKINVIKQNIGDSVLNGAISKVYKNKVILTDSCNKKDVKQLEKQGLDVLRLNGYYAIGNLVAINNNAMLIGSGLKKDEIKEIENFYGKKATIMDISGINVVGSCIALNDKNIAVCSQTTKEEFTKIKKIFKTTGNIATVNYGDAFVGNGLLVNNNGVLIGEKTTGYEIIRLDDIFG